MSEAKLMKASTATVTALLHNHNIDIKTKKDKRLCNLFAEQLWWLQLSDKSKLLPSVMKKVTRMWKNHSHVLRTDEERFGPLIRDDAELASITDRYDAEMNAFVQSRQEGKAQSHRKQ